MPGPGAGEDADRGQGGNASSWSTTAMRRRMLLEKKRMAGGHEREGEARRNEEGGRRSTVEDKEGGHSRRGNLKSKKGEGSKDGKQVDGDDHEKLQGGVGEGGNKEESRSTVVTTSTRSHVRGATVRSRRRRLQ